MEHSMGCSEKPRRLMFDGTEQMHIVYPTAPGLHNADQPRVEWSGKPTLGRNRSK